MIRIQSGFNVDLENSTGLYVNVKAGTLYNDNDNRIYSFSNKKFKKTLSVSKYVYFDIIDDSFKFTDVEISPVELDSIYETYCPLCYITIDNRGNITSYVKLEYGQVNVIPPEDLETNSILSYKPIRFITEKNLPIDGKTVVVTNKILQIFNLFIYDQGDVILGTIKYKDNVITLLEDVSPALCEVTYGYYYEHV